MSSTNVQHYANGGVCVSITPSHAVFAEKLSLEKIIARERWSSTGASLESINHCGSISISRIASAAGERERVRVHGARVMLQAVSPQIQQLEGCSRTIGVCVSRYIWQGKICGDKTAMATAEIPKWPTTNCSFLVKSVTQGIARILPRYCGDIARPCESPRGCPDITHCQSNWYHHGRERQGNPSDWLKRFAKVHKGASTNWWKYVRQAEPTNTNRVITEQTAVINSLWLIKKYSE